MQTRARAPTDEDRKLVHQIIERHITDRPAGIRRIEVEFGEDWTGYPAAYINLIIGREVKPTDEKINELNSFIRILHDEIIDADTAFWPYSRTLVRHK